MCMSLWVCIYVCRCVGIRESKPRYSWAVRRLLTRLPGNMRVGRIVAGGGWGEGGCGSWTNNGGAEVRVFIELLVSRWKVG